MAASSIVLTSSAFGRVPIDQLTTMLVSFAGRQDNLAIREAAIIALAFNLLMVGAAIVAILMTIPKGKKAAA